MIAEHYNNSFPPQHPSQCGQRIVKARMGLGGIPWHDLEAAFPIAIPDIPCPHHRVQPQAYHRRTFRSLAFPCLRLLAAQRLFGIHDAGRIKQFDEQLCQQFPHLGRLPAPWHRAVHTSACLLQQDFSTPVQALEPWSHFSPAGLSGRSAGFPWNLQYSAGGSPWSALQAHFFSRQSRA